MSLQNTTNKTSDAFDKEPGCAGDGRVQGLAEAAGGRGEDRPRWIRRTGLSWLEDPCCWNLFWEKSSVLLPSKFRKTQNNHC